MKRYIVIGLMGLWAFSEAQAQDLRFSQYHYTPFLTNPGMLGDNNDVKLLLNYRRQSTGGITFSTPMVSMNYPLISKKTGNRWGGAGLTVISDHIGNVLQDNGVMGGFAYQLNLGKSHLGMGVQAGYFQRSLDLAELTTDSQFLNGVFNSGNGTNENFMNSSRAYFSGGGGLMWYANDIWEQKKYYLGVSAFNVNQPNTALGDGAEDKMPVQIVAVGGVKVLDTDRFSIMPNARFVNRLDENLIQAGSWFNYNLPPKDDRRGTIGVGAWYNTNEWIVLSFEVNQPKYILAFSYDLPVSSNAKVSQGNGTIEFTLGLKFQRKVKKQIVDDTDPVDNNNTDNTNQNTDNNNNQNNNQNTDNNNQNTNNTDKTDKELTSQEKDILKRHVFFKYNSQELDEESKAFLDEVAGVLKDRPNTRIKLEGHTCNIGKEQENMVLSQKRAEIVKEYLMKKGLKPEQMITTGVGESEPLYPNNSDENRQKNRRVEFEVVKK